MRTTLFILVSFVGLTTIIFGLLLIAYPPEKAFEEDIDALRSPFFTPLLIPGIIFSIVGIVNMGAVFSAMQGGRNQYNWSLAGGLLLSGSIVTDIVMIRELHWLQLVYLVIGILIILLSYQLKGKWAV